jgi:hypothetical protein
MTAHDGKTILFSRALKVMSHVARHVAWSSRRPRGIDGKSGVTACDIMRHTKTNEAPRIRRNTLILLVKFLEASPGIEPGYKDLQAFTRH